METRAMNRSPHAALSLACLLALLAFCGCGGGDGTGSSEAAADSTAADSTQTEDESPRREKAIKVDVGAVVESELVIPVFADGVLRTTKTVEVRAKLSGQLTHVLVRDGDTVRRGQVLARIDSRDYRLSLEESRYAHIQALSQIAAEDEEQVDNPAALADFIARRDALEAEHDRGTLADESYRAKLLALELDALKNGAFRQDTFAQRTGLAAARIAEQRAQLNLEYTEIRAPFAGVVSLMTAVLGENISVGQTLCVVTDAREIEAAVNVLEADLGDLEPGRMALVAVTAVGDTIRGRVDVISPILDQASRTCQVLIRFPNEDGRFRPGMFCRAEIAALIHHDVLMVPRDAVLTRDDRPLVFKVTDEPRAQWLYVDTGRENSEFIEILKVHSGGSLAPGDQVVVSNHLTLAHEAKLSIDEVVPTPNRWAFATAEDGQ
jgi:multidrug efflux pump subunit AcrA (membrane-fusion protein)